MLRRARLAIPGVPWNIIQRGNNRAVCFAPNRLSVLFALPKKELAEQFDCAVHAYVLMTNHVHLLLTPHRSEGPVPRAWPKAMGFPAYRQ